MKAKIVCNIFFEDDYYDYQVYPLAMTFASSNEEALVQYVKHCNNPHIEIEEVNIMEAFVVSAQHKITFYEVKGKNTTLNSKISSQLTIIDVDYIE